MGVVDLNSAEVTLLSMGKRQVKRLDGSYGEAITFAKFCRVTLSDGTQYFADFKIVPGDISAGHDGDGVYENVFIEGYGVLSDGAGNVAHEKRGVI